MSSLENDNEWTEIIATVLEFPINKLPTSRNRWPAEEDLRAEVIELADYRPVPVEYPREWHAFAPINANLYHD